ncbi:MAG: hypothetical protein CYPHOPRED_001487, partial [Cyphobasidiales sp. Tagirdzhanova-0007]
MADTASPPTTARLEPHLTGKAKELDELAATEQMEAERLREEVLASRLARANRQQSRAQSISSLAAIDVAIPSSSPVISPSPSPSPSPANFQPSSTSYPVSLGRPSTTPGTATSLAHFIGGNTRIRAPILTKSRPEIQDGAGLETDDFTRPTATFLSRLGAAKTVHSQGEEDGPLHARRGSPSVAMPGMTKPGAASRWTGQSEKDKTSDLAPLLTHPTAFEKPKEVILPNRSPSLPTYIKPLQAGPAAIPPTSATSTPLSTNISSSSAAPTAISPKPANSIPSSMNTSSSSANDTPSLTRLRGTSLVKERLKWGEEKAGTASPAVPSPVGSPHTIRLQGAMSSPTPRSPASEAAPSSISGPADESSPSSASPGMASKAAKRRSVLDRYNPLAVADPAKETKAAYKSSYGVVSGSVSSAGPSAISPEDQSGNDSIHRSQSQPQARGQMPLSRSPDIEPSMQASKDVDSNGQKSDIPTAEEAGFGSEPERAKTVPPDFESHRADETMDSQSSLDYKASYGLSRPKSVQAGSAPTSSEQGTGANGSGHNALDGLPSPRFLSPNLGGEQNKIAAEGPVRSKSGSDYKSSYGVGAARPLPAEPARSQSVTEPRSSYGLGPGRGPHISSASPVPSPKPSLGLPISVSPSPYQRGPASSSPRSPASSPWASTGSFQPSATSFPVSLGISPTHNRPTSLAHFMGGKPSVTGPVLNKQRPEPADTAGMDVDYGGARGVGSFLSRNPNLLEEAAKRKSRVAMPGMVRPAPAAREELQEQGLQSLPSTTSPMISPLPLPGMPSPDRRGFSDPVETPRMEGLTVGDEEEGIPGPQTEIQTGAQPFPSSPMSVSPNVGAITPHREHPEVVTTHSLASVQLSDPIALEHIQPALSAAYAVHHSPTANSASIETVATTPNTASTYGQAKKEDWRTMVNTWAKPARHAPVPPSATKLERPISRDELSDRQIVKIPVTQYVNAGPRSPIDLSIFARPTQPSTAVTHYLSVDVLSLSGSRSTTLPFPCDTFYSSEALCVVLRYRQGGLVKADIVLWKGRHSLSGEAEEGKVKELEAQYRTACREIRQGCEDVDFVRALGGRLVSRQGSRVAFDILNTTMYRVRSPAKEVLLIDEVELHRSSLCSASAYVASVFQELFVWHGKGSTDLERIAAYQYAQELSQGQRDIVEVYEGREGSLFSDIMGDHDYASANFWRFRRAADVTANEVAIYAVNADASTAIEFLGDGTLSKLPSDCIMLLDLIFELFVLVPPVAHDNRKDVSLALRTAQAISATRAKDRAAAFRLPVHALVMPSVIPLDVAAVFRSRSLQDLNGSLAPVYMNVLD